MRKFLSILLVICMALSMSAVAEFDAEEIEEAVEFESVEIEEIDEPEEEFLMTGDTDIDVIDAVIPDADEAPADMHTAEAICPVNASGEHRWEADARDNMFCTYCGEYCGHESITEFPGDRYEDYDRKICGVGRDNGNGTHTAKYCIATPWVCDICGQEGENLDFSKPVTRTEEHIWLDGKCYICDLVNTCTHPANRQFIKDIPNFNDVEIITRTSSMHKVKIRWEHTTVCLDCGNVESTIDEEYKLYPDYSHSFLDGVCEVCGYTYSCTHADAEYEEEDVYDEDYCGPAVDNGNGTHTAYFGVYYTRTCDFCGEDSGYDYSSLRLKTALHEWEDGVCTICGTVNTCTHPEEAVAGDRVMDFVDTVVSKDAKKHTVKAWFFYDTYCSLCGQVLRSDEGEETEKVTEAHSFTSDGYCDVCDYKCPHTYRSSDYVRSVELLASDPKTHTIRTEYILVTSCEVCGMKLSTSEDAAEEVTEMHVLTDPNGVCEVCGTKVECEHMNMFIAREDFITVADTARSIDKQQHIAQIVPVTVYMCPDCGLEFTEEHYENARFETIDHSFDSEKCTECGYINNCKHGTKKTVKSSSVYKTLSMTASEHVYLTRTRSTVYCAVAGCGAHLSSSYSGASSKVSGKHSFDPETRMCACGYIAEPGDMITAIYFGDSVDPVPAEITLGVGESWTLPVHYQPASAVDTVSYHASGSAVTVNSNGVITAKASGTAVVTASACGVSESIKITVKAAVTRASLNMSTVTLGQGEMAELKASLTGTSFCQEWTSDNDAVTVYSNGVIKVAKDAEPGTVATITFNTFKPAVKASCKVITGIAMTGLNFVDDAEIGLQASGVPTALLTLSVGQKVRAAAQASPENCVANLVYTSSDPAVVSVDQTGMLAAKSAGTALITVTGYNAKYSAALEVTVTPAPKKLVIGGSASTMNVSDLSCILDAMSYDAEGNDIPADITWTSSSVKILKVEPSRFAGRSFVKLVPVKGGTATITAKTQNGIKATYKVTVKNDPSMTKSSVSVSAVSGGMSTTASVKLLDAAGKATVVVKGTPVWALAEAPAGVSIDQNGLVTAAPDCEAGTAIVRYYPYGDEEKGCIEKAMKISAAPAQITLNKTSPLKIAKRKSVTVKASALDAAGDPVSPVVFTYVSDAPTIATVNASGKITGKKAGTAHITVIANANEDGIGTAETVITVTVK